MTQCPNPQNSRKKKNVQDLETLPIFFLIRAKDMLQEQKAKEDSDTGN
jgi:hypothetical protein